MSDIDRTETPLDLAQLPAVRPDSRAPVGEPQWQLAAGREPTGHAMYDEAMAATGSPAFAYWLIQNHPWGGVDLRAGYRDWDARTALADAMLDYADDAQFRGPLCRAWLAAGLPPLGLPGGCAHQSCSLIAESHECRREQFLDDPITRANGVGGEMVHLIPCPVCDALERQ